MEAILFKIVEYLTVGGGSVGAIKLYEAWQKGRSGQQEQLDKYNELLFRRLIERNEQVENENKNLNRQLAKLKQDHFTLLCKVACHTEVVPVPGVTLLSETEVAE